MSFFTCLHDFEADFGLFISFFQDVAVKLDGDPSFVCLTLTVVDFFRDVMLAGGNAIGDLSTLK